MTEKTAANAQQGNRGRTAVQRNPIRSEEAGLRLDTLGLAAVGAPGSAGLRLRRAAGCLGRFVEAG